MNAASASTSTISRSTTHMARRPFVWLAAIVLAGCAQAPQQPERAAACPPARPCPVCPVCPAPPEKPLPEAARFEPVAFDALPGWQDAALEPSLRAFLAGCARVQGALAGARARAREGPPGGEPPAPALLASALALFSGVS